MTETRSSKMSASARINSGKSRKSAPMAVRPESPAKAIKLATAIRDITATVNYTSRATILAITRSQ